MVVVGRWLRLLQPSFFGSLYPVFVRGQAYAAIDLPQQRFAVRSCLWRGSSRLRS
jgi:hypothetical protein